MTLNGFIEDMQTKTNSVSSNASKDEFFINASKIKIMKVNCGRIPHLLNDKVIADIDSFI